MPLPDIINSPLYPLSELWQQIWTVCVIIRALHKRKKEVLVFGYYVYFRHFGEMLMIYRVVIFHLYVMCRHEKYATQYRAIFVVNCKMKSEEVLQPENQKRKRGGRWRNTSEDTVKPVCCSVCSTEVGVMDEEEVYHFFNVLPSEPWTL